MGTKNLNEADHSDLNMIFGSYVSIANCQNGCAAEIKGIYIFNKCVLTFNTETSHPIDLISFLSHMKQNNSDNMSDHHETEDQVKSLKVILIFFGKTHDSERFIELTSSAEKNVQAGKF